MSSLNIFPEDVEYILRNNRASASASTSKNSSLQNVKLNNFKQFGLCEKLLIVLSYFLLVIGFPFTLCFCYKIAKEYQRAVIFRLGKILNQKPKGPGLFFSLPCIDTPIIVDLRIQTFNIQPQEILTKDSVTITVDAVVYVRIYDPTLSIINVQNAQFSTKQLAAAILRNTLGTKTLQQILKHNELISNQMKYDLFEVTHQWGIRIERVEIKDVILPYEMQRIMAVEAEATREARAHVISCIGEKEASANLREAAKKLSQSKCALQLRYLHAMSELSVDKNTTVLFPLLMQFSPQQSNVDISNRSSGGVGIGSGNSGNSSSSIVQKSFKKFNSSNESLQKSTSSKIPISANKKPKYVATQTRIINSKPKI